MSDRVCPDCSRPLMKIDHYGEVLVVASTAIAGATQATISWSWS